LALLAAVVVVAMFGQFKIGGWAFTAGAVGSLLALTFQVVAPVTQRALGLFITGLVMLLASWLLIRRDKRKSLKTLDSAN
jgi:O-antigen/teichoic acid export membrane protein